MRNFKSAHSGVYLMSSIYSSQKFIKEILKISKFLKFRRKGKYFLKNTYFKTTPIPIFSNKYGL
ncbi:hypothetical protein SAMN05878281_1282 [Salegentibacter salegens]|uniref:Uncharacterized protein n=1 Tax=Salegentibacter salegens TaxID=143223 RepID=A0A1M7K728_9FLAO|nr:hypothetical protein LY58_02497 [Salegentibacter salegens]SHM61122.1 hypothetical protein SAMN05878281_1282 [Salegentibacter salegens]